MPARCDLGRLLAVLLMCSVALVVMAEMPSAEAMQAARQQMRDAISRVAAPAAARALPVMPDARALARQPVPAMPNIGVPASRVDMSEIASRATDLTHAWKRPEGQGTDLLIFVTFGMPRETLRLLAEQASRAGGVLMVRGLVDDSMRRTLAVVKEVLGGQTVPWQIDPEAFRRYAIVQAPTFVLARSVGPCQGVCAQTSAQGDSFVRVAGDVSLDYALEVFARSDDGWRTEAHARLVRMRGQP